MRNIITAVIVAVVALLSLPAYAEYLPAGKQQEDQVPSKDRVQKYLESDYFVLSRQELRQLSSDIVADLAGIATSRRAPTHARARAVASLALYRRDARAQAAVDALFESVSSRDRLMPAVIDAYGLIHGEDAADDLAGHLSSSVKRVRLAAVAALGRYGGQAGYEMLAERGLEETDADVQAAIGRYVQ